MAPRKFKAWSWNARSSSWLQLSEGSEAEVRTFVDERYASAREREEDGFAMAVMGAREQPLYGPDVHNVEVLRFPRFKLWTWDRDTTAWSNRATGGEREMREWRDNAYDEAVATLNGGFAAVVFPQSVTPTMPPQEMPGVRIVGAVPSVVADEPSSAVWVRDSDGELVEMFVLWQWNSASGSWSEIARGSKVKLVPILLTEREEAKRFHLSDWAMAIKNVGAGWPSHVPVTENFGKRWEPAKDSWAIWLGMHVVRVDELHALPGGDIGYADISTAGGQSLTVPLVELSKH